MTAELRDRIFDIVKKADLDSTTPKTIRQELEASLQVDLSSHREAINELIDEALAARMNSMSAIDQDMELAKELQRLEQGRETRGKRKKTVSAAKRMKRPHRAGASTPFNRPLVLSEVLRAVVGAAELSRPQMIKQLWTYIKEKNLQDPTDRRYILCDEPLMAVFRKERVNCFAINKMLTAHVKAKEDLVGFGETTGHHD